MRQLKLLVMLLVLGMTVMSFASEKVAWCPQEKIGKNKVWKSKAQADFTAEGLKINLDGKQWRGAGLNWQSFWPAGSGVKIADYKYLLVSLKGTGQVAGLAFTLKDNKNKTSAAVQVKPFCPNGKLPVEFTTIKIPIAKFTGAKSQLQSDKVWELMVGIWTAGETNANVTINKVAFSTE